MTGPTPGQRTLQRIAESVPDTTRPRVDDGADQPGPVAEVPVDQPDGRVRAGGDGVDLEVATALDVNVNSPPCYAKAGTRYAQYRPIPGGDASRSGAGRSCVAERRVLDRQLLDGRHPGAGRDRIVRQDVDGANLPDCSLRTVVEVEHVDAAGCLL